MPGKIDEQRRFIPVNIAVLTVSDSRTLDTDTSGAALVECLEAAGHRLAARTILPDDADRLEAQFRSWIDDDDIDVVISTRRHRRDRPRRHGRGFEKGDRQGHPRLR